VSDSDCSCDLKDLPNIGKSLAEKLNRIGVFSRAELAELGSVEAVIRIGLTSGSGCYNMLYALEGALQGVRWHSLPEAVRHQLKSRLDQARSQATAT
jgi:DNA transformation protein